MNVALTLSPEHRTHDGHHGQYCTIADALTGRTLGRFQHVTRTDGSHFYRAVDGSPYPEGCDSTGAILYAMAEHERRRAQRPPRPPKPSAPPVRRPRHQQAGRFYVPPRPMQPMRRLLVDKLAARQARKAVA